MNHIPFDNNNYNISGPKFHFIPSSLINILIISQNIRKNKINKILFIFINKYDLDDLIENFKLTKLEYSPVFKYIHYPINIINLINTIKKYKTIITDSNNIAILSSKLFISCVLFKKNYTQFQMSKLIYKLDYIRPLSEINSFLNDFEKIERIEYKK